MKKKNILFVGAFNKNTSDGSTGGQLFACTSLVESELGERYNFIKLDTTSPTVPAPPIYQRLPKVFFRLFDFIYKLTFYKIESVLIFSSAKLSFIEKGMMVFIARGYGKKVIFAPRSGLSLIDYESSRFMKLFMPIVIKSSTYVLCQGESWKIFYQKISSEKNEKFIIINNWIDTKPYFQQKVIDTAHPIKIIYIGWFEEYKGIKDLLDAVKILSDRNITFVCDLYGSGSLNLFIEKYIKQYSLEKFVVVKGWANPEVKLKALNAANIFVLPSHFEGFPNSLLEAMASELPVITTNIASISDIIEHQYNGILVNKTNPNQLANMLEELIKNEEERTFLAKNARKTVLEKFTIESAINKFDKIL